MLPRGLGSFVAMPMVGLLMTRIESRRLLMAGILFASLSYYSFAHLNLNIGYWDLFWPLILQGASIGLVFIPLTTITNDPVPKEEMGNATSLFNLMRNVGASIGIATVTTMLTRNQQIHTNVLGEHVNVYNPAARSMLQGIRAGLMAKGVDATTAARQADAAVFGIVHQQAVITSYNDVFRMLMIIFMCSLPLVFLMRKPKHQAGGMAMH